jgi:hypothetical protein
VDLENGNRLKKPRSVPGAEANNARKSLGETLVSDSKVRNISSRQNGASSNSKSRRAIKPVLKLPVEIPISNADLEPEGLNEDWDDLPVLVRQDIVYPVESDSSPEDWEGIEDEEEVDAESEDGERICTGPLPAEQPEQNVSISPVGNDDDKVVAVANEELSLTPGGSHTASEKQLNSFVLCNCTKSSVLGQTFITKSDEDIFCQVKIRKESLSLVAHYFAIKINHF